jgi:hypothetical protein
LNKQAKEFRRLYKLSGLLRPLKVLVAFFALRMKNFLLTGDSFKTLAILAPLATDAGMIIDEFFLLGYAILYHGTYIPNTYLVLYLNSSFLLYFLENSYIKCVQNHINPDVKPSKEQQNR